MTDQVDNAFDIPEHSAVPKSQNAITFRFDQPRSRIVAVKFCGRVVLTAIEFDDKPAFVASEVDDEAGDWHLAAEMPALVLEYAQLIPELLLGIGNVASGERKDWPFPDPHPSPQGGGE
jgi:hypothetical protein